MAAVVVQTKEVAEVVSDTTDASPVQVEVAEVIIKKEVDEAEMNIETVK